MQFPRDPKNQMSTEVHPKSFLRFSAAQKCSKRSSHSKKAALSALLFQRRRNHATTKKYWQYFKSLQKGQKGTS